MLVPKMLSQVVTLALEAGELIRAELHRPGGLRGSGDKADIDLEVELMLRHGLEQILRCDFLYCWIVDPNDGTADFLAGRAGSAVSVGLLEEGVPVLGVVYAPATTRGPDCIAWQKGMRSLLRNGQIVDLSRRSPDLHGSVVFVSAAAESRRDENDALCFPAVCEPMPSIAYRLARVAAGDGVAGVSLFPVAPHDLVAGHALLLAAGGDLFDQNGLAIRYTISAEFSGPVAQCFGGNIEACRALIPRSWKSLLN